MAVAVARPFVVAMGHALVLIDASALEVFLTAPRSLAFVGAGEGAATAVPSCDGAGPSVGVWKKSS